MQGYELRLPTGWRVARDDGALVSLQPRRGGAQIDVQVTFATPEQYPGGPPQGF